MRAMNEENKLKEIKKEDSKKKPIFFIALIVLAFLGGFTGYFMSSKEETLEAILNIFMNNSQILSIFFGGVLVVFGFVAIIIGITGLSRAKKLWAKEDERDDNWDKIEKKLSNICTFMSSSIILSFFLYGCSMYNIRGNLKDIDDGIRTLNMMYRVSFGASLIADLVCSSSLFKKE